MDFPSYFCSRSFGFLGFQNSQSQQQHLCSKGGERPHEANFVSREIIQLVSIITRKVCVGGIGPIIIVC